MRADEFAEYDKHRLHHEAEPRYGTFGHRWAPYVRTMAQAIGAKTILDYGCGKGMLKPALPEFEVREYDPGVPGKDSRPEPADLVVCADVLVFVGEARLGTVLDEIDRCKRRGLLIIVPQHPRHKVKPDDDFLSLQRPLSWWEARLSEKWPAMRFRPLNAMTRMGTRRLLGVYP